MLICYIIIIDARLIVPAPIQALFILEFSAKPSTSLFTLSISNSIEMELTVMLLSLLLLKAAALPTVVKRSTIRPPHRNIHHNVLIDFRCGSFSRGCFHLWCWWSTSLEIQRPIANLEVAFQDLNDNHLCFSALACTIVLKNNKTASYHKCLRIVSKGNLLHDGLLLGRGSRAYRSIYSRMNLEINKNRIQSIFFQLTSERICNTWENYQR